MASVSVLTPSGRGAVATLRVDGVAVLESPYPLFLAANGRTVVQQSVGRVVFGRWGDDTPEEVVLCRVDEDALEIHCHGGDAAVARIIADLEARGCVRRCLAGWQGQERSEWPCERRTGPSHWLEPPPPEQDLTRVAVSSSSSSAGASPSRRDTIPADELIEAECREALTRATTLRTADMLWQQCQGRLATAMIELETLPANVANRRAGELLRWEEFGRHLTEPWRVVLCGLPNVGKSSLVNALVGFGRSIVFDQPGTTRDVVTAETAFDGWPIELSDTAGLREGADEVETAGILRARQHLATADLRVLVLDASQPAQDEDRALLSDWPDAIVVAHKCDLPVMWESSLPRPSMPVSSLTGEGVNMLAQEIVSRLIPELPPPRTLIPVTARQVTLLAHIILTTES